MKKKLTMKEIIEIADKENLLPSDIIEREGIRFEDELLEEYYDNKMESN